MAIEEVVGVLPLSVVSRIDGLVTIFKAVGVAVLVYVVYLLVKGFFSFRRMKRMRNIEKKVDSIDRKLNILLKDKKSKK